MSHDPAHDTEKSSWQKIRVHIDLVDWEVRDGNEMCKVYNFIVFWMQFLRTQSLNQ